MTSSTPSNQTLPVGSTEQWKDGKRYLWLIGLVVPSLAFIAFGMFQLTGWSVWLWIAPIIILGVVPAIDLFAGLDRSNPPDDVIERLEQDTYYRWITYVFLPIQYIGFLGAFIWIAKPEWLGVAELSTLDKIGIAISIGAIGGIGINTAHELGHKKESHERWLSKIALAQSFYGHFYIEHNRGHHVRVATPEDPASSRLGENFYQFWFRTVSGSLKSAWRLEKKRYARKGKHPFRIGNDVLNAWLMSTVLWGALMVVLGWQILPLLVDPGHRRLLAARGRQLHGALRDAAPEGRRRRAPALRARRPQPQLELQQHRDQRAALPPAAAQRPPRQPDPALPDAAGLRGVPGAADGVRRDDRARHRPGRLATGDGPPRRGPLRRRRHAGQHQPAQARQDHRQVRRTASLGGSRSRASRALSQPPEDRAEVMAARCPGCGYTYEVARGDEHEGFAAGTAWADVPDSWCCPDCGVREKVDFVAGGERAGLMRIDVDRDKCEGLGMCEAMAHEYFELDDDDTMTVLEESPPEEDRSKVHAAVEACPVMALSLVG